MARKVIRSSARGFAKFPKLVCILEFKLKDVLHSKPKPDEKLFISYVVRLDDGDGNFFFLDPTMMEKFCFSSFIRLYTTLTIPQ